MKGHVLLLEPNRILARQYAEVLQQHGYHVIAAADAQSAILAADAQTPDVVITELLLARHSGIEFLYEFRSYSEWQQIPTIVLSRAQNSELGINQKTMRELGITRVLYKHTIPLALLAEIVDDMLASKQSA